MPDDPEARDREFVQAVFEDSSEEAPMEAVAAEDAEGTTAAEEAPLSIEATGVTSHVLVCSGTIAKSKSTFRAPSTGWLYMRVGYFNAAGARLWLSPWTNHSVNALTTTFHVESWNFAPNRVARAVVVSRFPAWTDVDGSRWASC